MAMYKHMAEAWINPKSGVKELTRSRAIKWRREPTVTRVEKPTRLNRARVLGYKAKQGFVVARVRVRRGGLRKRKPKGGRRQKRMGISKITAAKSIKQIAEERVAKKYPNLKVLNSYWIWQDGTHKWYEVILIDPAHPVIAKDPHLNWASGKK